MSSRNPILLRLDTVDDGDISGPSTIRTSQTGHPLEGKFSLGKFTTPGKLNRSRTTTLSSLTSNPYLGSSLYQSTAPSSPTYQSTAPSSPNLLNLTSNLPYLPTSNVTSNSPTSSPSPNLTGLGRKK